jgi:hypothetical protein
VAVAGFFVWHGAAQPRKIELLAGAKPEAPAGTAKPSPEPPRHEQDSLAMRYAVAVQNGNCDVIIPHTEWMRERLKTVLAGGADGEVNDKVRGDLCDKIQKRPSEGNQLRKEGVEDQYVFAPGAVFEWISADSGRTDLETTVKRRTWIRVTFPLRSRALADRTGRPIHSLVVGINVSADDCVVKANVVGNLDIDYGSFKFDWPSG